MILLAAAVEAELAFWRPRSGVEALAMGVGPVEAASALATALADLDDPSLIALAKVGSNRGAKHRNVLDSLTPREFEVVQLLTLGRTNREIAAEL